jgi:hypothetical protein
MMLVGVEEGRCRLQGGRELSVGCKKRFSKTERPMKHHKMGRGTPHKTQNVTFTCCTSQCLLMEIVMCICVCARVCVCVHGICGKMITEQDTIEEKQQEISNTTEVVHHNTNRF